MQDLRDRGIITGWRERVLPHRPIVYLPRIRCFLMERAAVPVLGGLEIRRFTSKWH
jgi:hypothetical protein